MAKLDIEIKSDWLLKRVLSIIRAGVAKIPYSTFTQLWQS